MKQLTYNQLTIEVYTDPDEWITEFFENSDECNMSREELLNIDGFADIEGNIIYLFKRVDYTFVDILATIAHEYGHIIKNSPSDDIPLEPEYNELHEEKAEFYEEFVLDCYKLTELIMNIN